MKCLFNFRGLFILSFNCDCALKGERDTSAIEFIHSNLRVITARLTDLDDAGHGRISKNVHYVGQDEASFTTFPLLQDFDKLSIIGTSLVG